MRASGRRISIFDSANGQFWQFVILTAAGTLAASSQADAALFYWNRDSAYYGGYEPMPLLQPHRQKPKRSTAKTNPATEKQAGGKPQGPLIISVSIDQQRVSVYDANGLYAQSPVSTGMKGHSTPMGVFSVIQKQKYHQSNIYSGAPMPYMQRITWSGIAMHAGVLPGYPASHGCIRMPLSFAVRMYNWTRMGARVFVTPATISPESFSHPMLMTQKVAPQQPVADDVLKMDAPLGVKSDKGADKPQTGLDLRTSVGHAAPASLRDNTHTADASAAMPAASASVTMSDASSSASSAPSDAIADQLAADKSEPTKPETAAADKPAETNFATDDKTVGETTGSTDTPKPEVSANDPVKAEANADTPKTDTPKTDTAKTDTAKTDAAKDKASKDVAKAADTAKAADKAADKSAEAATAADAPDAKKDPARLPGVAKIDVSKRAGQIAVFISRKDSKLYVRQNFAPLFEVPVTIEASDRPLGTHVFTAEADKTDTNLLRWSVVTLPTRNAARIEVEERASHRRKVATAAPAEAKPQPATNTPEEALDRISIPSDAMARINEALGTGGSIIVSDLSVNQGETGEGTDFILPLR
ncbi:lipoprotein-anchoring transpeptidase ErfK/SrfK [Bradyrhizobium sp. i1.8.4]|uniref:L,D-transpeptidase n=1 Tax=unclassified Bradyrhizobium TaxID=2631580 RepID=UPI003D21FC79